MLKGYQLLGFRLKTRAGEIDILARRGKTLAVVEVKRRASDRTGAARPCGPDQYERLLSAGQRGVAPKTQLGRASAAYRYCGAGLRTVSGSSSRHRAHGEGLTEGLTT